MMNFNEAIKHITRKKLWRRRKKNGSRQSWSLPNEFLCGFSAAAGIALINSFGNIGGFIGPYVMGAIKNQTGSFRGGLVFAGISLFASAMLMVALQKRTEHWPLGYKPWGCQSNQTMKPTATLRSNFSVFATTRCLSHARVKLSRQASAVIVSVSGLRKLLHTLARSLNSRLHSLNLIELRGTN